MPLALHLAGTYLASPFAQWHAFDDYRLALDGAGLPVALAELDATGQAKRGMIRQTWDLSLDALEVSGRPQVRRLLFLLCCYAANTPIPVSLLQPGLLSCLSDKETADGADARLTTERRLRDAGLQGLAALSLIDIAAATPGEWQIILHPALADAIRSRFTAYTELSSLAGAAVTLLLKRAEPLDFTRPSDWPIWKMLAPHVATLLETLAPRLDSAIVMDLLAVSNSATAALLWSGDLVAAETLARDSLVPAAALGADHPANLAARHNLARVIAEKGRYQEAEELYRSVLPQRQKALGDDARDTLRTRHHLARVIGLQGRRLEAETLYRELLRDQQRVLGDDHLDTLATRHELTRVISWQGGREAEAEARWRELLGDQERVLGHDHLDTLVTRHGLARVIGIKGSHAEAENLLRALYADERRVLGDNHPDTIKTCRELARVIAQQDRPAEAATLYEQALAAQTRILGADHPDTLDTRLGLKQVADQGHGVQARALPSMSGSSKRWGGRRPS